VKNLTCILVILAVIMLKVKLKMQCLINLKFYVVSVESTMNCSYVDTSCVFAKFVDVIYNR